MLQNSAGIFNNLKGSVMLLVQQDPTPDLNPDTLGALASLMLAQAQEIIVHKAIHGIQTFPIIWVIIKLTVIYQQTT